VVGVLIPLPHPCYNSFVLNPPPLMLWPLAQCSDLQTRQVKWISRADQLKNGSRPSAYIHWGLPATVLAAQFSETHALDVARCPISGWRSTQ
jgi:hypothetical protein